MGKLLSMFRLLFNFVFRICVVLLKSVDYLITAFDFTWKEISKRMSAICLLILSLFSFCWAIAQTIVPPVDVNGAVALLPQLMAAIASGNHNVAYGIVLMFIVLGIRQYVLPKAKISAEMLPIIAAVLSSLGMVAVSITVPGATIGPAVLNGLVAAVFASGAWELLGKAVAKQILGKLYVDPVKTPAK